VSLEGLTVLLGSFTVLFDDDAVQHIKVNTNENMHTVPHCGPKRDENLHYTHQWQQNSDIQYSNNPLNDMNHLTNTADVGLFMRVAICLRIIVLSLLVHCLDWLR
jgi:hypothetical protein